MAVVSKKAPNRTVSNQNPEWWRQPPSWDQTADKSAQSTIGSTTTSGGPWGATWGTPPAPMQTPGGATGGGPGVANTINQMYGIDLKARYTAGNVIRIKDGNFYRVIGSAADVTGKDRKGAVKVRGRDGTLYYMKPLSKKEAQNLSKEGKPITPSAAPGAGGGSSNNRGFQPAGDWWTQDWWDRPGFYKRMF